MPSELIRRDDPTRDAAEVMAEARRLQAEHGAALLWSLGRALRNALPRPHAGAGKRYPQLKAR